MPRRLEPQGFEARPLDSAVLILTCPCGRGLAVPAVLTAASGRLFRDGILLKDGEALETLATVDAAVVDKTGTLTTGQPTLTNAAALDPAAFAAAALATGGEHPLSPVIAQRRRRACRRPRLDLPSLGDRGPSQRRRPHPRRPHRPRRRRAPAGAGRPPPHPRELRLLLRLQYRRRAGRPRRPRDSPRALRHDQFDDPQGHANRILSDRDDDPPAGEDDRAG